MYSRFLMNLMLRCLHLGKGPQVAKHFNRTASFAVSLFSLLFITACVPSQKLHGLDTPGGRWIDDPDSSPTHTDLNYIDRRQTIGVAAPTENALSEIRQPLNLELTQAKNLMLISTDDTESPIQQTDTLFELSDSELINHYQRKNLSWPHLKPPLSPGDRVQVNVMNGQEFSGLFEIDIDGTLNIPYLPALHVAGGNVLRAQKIIHDALLNAGFFRPGLLSVDVSIQQWSPIQVSVSGAVFSPGTVSINVRQAEALIAKGNPVSGDNPHDRFLHAALRAAGGVRPDAAVDRIVLIRGNKKYKIDMSGQFVGLESKSIAMMAGDQVIVPSTGRFDESLVKITPITPPGIRLFLSNLTVPATDNSKSQNDSQSSSVPYGTRFLTGLVSANCVGGTGATNSARYGVLITKNPISGETEVIERPLEQLMDTPEQEKLNPYLMPNDGIACYDSGVTNLRDIFKTLTDIISPINILSPFSK